MYTTIFIAALDQATNCGNPESIPNLPANSRIAGANLGNPNSFVPGAQLRIECEGECYHPSSASITCLPSGTWGPQMPRDIYCRRKSFYTSLIVMYIKIRSEQWQSMSVRTVPICSENSIHYLFCRSSVVVPIRMEWKMPRGLENLVEQQET